MPVSTSTVTQSSSQAFSKPSPCHQSPKKMSARNPASSLRLRLPLLLCTYISLLILCSCFVSGAEAYSVKISDADELRQSCSGMWGGKAKRRETKIEG